MRLLDIFDSFFLLEALEGAKATRSEFLKGKYGKDFKGLPGYGPDDIDKLLDKIGEVDPTRNGNYMDWIGRLIFSKPNENRTEDLDRVGQDLRNFERFKAQLPEKDINRYKSFVDVGDAVHPFTLPRPPTDAELEKKRQAEEFAKLKDEIITVYNGPEGWIRIPKTEAAATYLGQGTKWCTTGTNSQFGYYNKSDNLFVVQDKEIAKVYNAFMKQQTSQPAGMKWADYIQMITKQNGGKIPPNGKYQLHVESGQYAADNDRNQGTNTVPLWARPYILEYYKANNPNLTWKQIMVLSTFGNENLAVGTKWEGVVNMYSLYDAIENKDYKKLLYSVASIPKFNATATPEYAEDLDGFKPDLMKDMLTGLADGTDEALANVNATLAQLESFGMQWPELKLIRAKLHKLM